MGCGELGTRAMSDSARYNTPEILDKCGLDAMILLKIASIIERELLV